jgi:hypothetical protein
MPGFHNQTGPVISIDRTGCWTRWSKATERRHFAQLPEVIQSATFSGSVGMRRATFASSGSRRLAQNLTIADSTRKFIAEIHSRNSYRHPFEARMNKGWL